MTINIDKLERKNKISQSEEVVSRYKEKERKACDISEQVQQLYRRQEELLNEVLHYSQGTVAEQSARMDIEDLEHQYREVMAHLSGGQEELRDSIKKETRKQEQLEEDLFYLAKKEREEAEHAKDSL